MKTDKTMKPLPDKPSELIRLALHDLKLCEQDPKFKINMNVWCETSYATPEICYVCLAGSVMAKSLNVVDLWSLSSDFIQKMLALDNLRMGIIDLRYFRVSGDERDAKWIPCYMKVREYSDDQPQPFHDDMEAMAAMFEGHGL